MRERSTDVRPWHYIRRNVRTCTPTSCLFVDTETTGIPIEGNPNATLQVLRLWCARHVRLEKGKVRGSMSAQGTTCEQFWALVETLLSERRPLWLFAHNLGFDLTVLRFWEKLDDDTFSFLQMLAGEKSHRGNRDARRWSGFAVLDDPPTIIECRLRDTKKVLICNDTYNYFRCSVSALGESIGVPKLPMPDDIEPIGYWFAYCSQDVKVIETAIVKLMQFVQKHDLGMWRYTAPAQSMSAYRHRFMHKPILVHGNADALQLEREAYYGGRLECKFIGCVITEQQAGGWFFDGRDNPTIPTRIGPVYVLDVQSCYPAMMLWHIYPRAIGDYYISPKISDLLCWLDKYCAIARVEIETTTEPYPYRCEGKTILAIGRYVTSLCGPELKTALDHGNIRCVGAVALYQYADLFSEYISFFWNLRTQAKKDGNKVQETWCKLMLNSLSGKFGQRARKWEDTDDVPAKMPWGLWSQTNTITGESHRYRSLAWAVQEEQDAGESIDSCPAISAYITSYAREYMRELLKTAGQENVYYVDTDCLHCNELGYSRLNSAGKIRDGDLGMLRLVGTYDTAEYRGLKDYTLGDTRCIAGIRANAEQVSNGQWRQDKFQKLRSILSGQPPAGVRVERVTIDRRIGLDPLRIGPDGTVSYQVVGR